MYVIAINLELRFYGESDVHLPQFLVGKGKVGEHLHRARMAATYNHFLKNLSPLRKREREPHKKEREGRLMPST